MTDDEAWGHQYLCVLMLFYFAGALLTAGFVVTALAVRAAL